MTYPCNHVDETRDQSQSAPGTAGTLQKIDDIGCVLSRDPGHARVGCVAFREVDIRF